MRPVLLLLLTCNAHALRTPHPLLSNAAARTYRAAAATHFAQIMPLVKPSLLAGSENKTEDRAAVLSNRSMAHLKCGLFDQALQDATHCIALRPDWSKAYFRRGEVFRHLGRWREAEINFRLAHSKDPSDMYLLDLVSEAAAKAVLSAAPLEKLLPLEERLLPMLYLPREALWPVRCAIVGFIVGFVLGCSQPSGSTNNLVFNIMLATGGLLLGGSGRCWPGAAPPIASN